MFNALAKKLRFLQFLSKNTMNENIQENSLKILSTDISAVLEHNLTHLRSIFNKSADIHIREFKFGGCVDAALVFVDGLVNKKTINEDILQTLMYDTRQTYSCDKLVDDSINTITTAMVSIGAVKYACDFNEFVHGVLSGDAGLLINGSAKALLINSRGWEARSVQEPITEAVVRGPREGFTETLSTNTALLRRKIKSPNLIIETIVLGERTKTDVAIAYINGIVNPALITEIKRRLDRIKSDAILESGYIEQFIEDNPLSPFSTIANSERPDVIAAKILEGRAAIFIDGTPIVLSMPMLLIENFQSPEDYYSRPYYASIIRSLRYIAFFISILAPASYVALTTYHQELLPTPLLITMAASREGIPFPAVAEALGMGIVFEILREAGVRLPRPVGQAISIVGALVIGESAVSAGLITAPMVIVVAFTAICSFVVPALLDVQSIMRIILVLLAGFMGEFGIVIGLLGVLIHLCALRSFGAPYLSPFAPLSVGGLKDTFVRVPLWLMLFRPSNLGDRDPQRQAFRLMPKPPEKGE